MISVKLDKFRKNGEQMSANANPNNPGFGNRSQFKNFNRKKRLRERLHVNIYILPNLLTIMNMFFGYYALIQSINGNFLMAAYAICAGAVFDLLDGRVARMTRSTSEFGAQLDSLSDLVSFCLAPGVLLYQWALEPFHRVGWMMSFFFVACGALRLARFNVQKGVVSSSYFRGLPTPMAAGIVASAVMAFQDLNWVASKSYIILSITALLGIVMVSNFPYRSFKDLDFKQRVPFRYLVFGVFLLAAIAMRPEVNLFITFMIYAILGAVFGIFKIGRQPKFATKDTDDTEV